MSFDALEEIFEVTTDEDDLRRRLTTSEFDFDGVMIQVKRSSLV